MDTTSFDDTFIDQEGCDIMSPTVSELQRTVQEQQRIIRENELLITSLRRENEELQNRLRTCKNDLFSLRSRHNQLVERYNTQLTLLCKDVMRSEIHENAQFNVAQQTTRKRQFSFSAAIRPSAPSSVPCEGPHSLIPSSIGASTVSWQPLSADGPPPCGRSSLHFSPEAAQPSPDTFPSSVTVAGILRNCDSADTSTPPKQGASYLGTPGSRHSVCGHPSALQSLLLDRK